MIGDRFPTADDIGRHMKRVLSHDYPSFYTPEQRKSDMKDHMKQSKINPCYKWTYEDIQNTSDIEILRAHYTRSHYANKTQLDRYEAMLNIMYSNERRNHRIIVVLIISTLALAAPLIYIMWKGGH